MAPKSAKNSSAKDLAPERNLLTLQLCDIRDQLRDLSDQTQDDFNVDTADFVAEEAKYLREAFEKLKTQVFEFNAHLSDNDSIDSIDVQSAAFHAAYTCIMLKCKSVRCHTPSPAPSSIPSVVGPTNFIEKLSLTHWDGRIEGWNEWYSLYKNAVEDNASLSPTQKFLYMKKYLSNEPLAIVSDFEVNDHNYEAALNQLKERYQNTRRLGNYYLNKLLSYEKSNDHSNFLCVHRTAVSCLKNLEVEDLSDFLLMLLAYDNLDWETKTAFDLSLGEMPGHVPKLDTLLKFVQKAAINTDLRGDNKPARCATLSIEKAKNPPFTVSASKPEPWQNKGRYTRASAPVPTKRMYSIRTPGTPIVQACPLCNKKHKLYSCEEFRKLSPQLRSIKVREWLMCSNCFGNNHTSSECRSRFSCSVCSEKHHSMLHGTNAVVGCAAEATKNLDQVLLGTITCEVRAADGHYVKIKCLADSGAQISLARSSLAKQLGLAPKPTKNQVTGVSSVRVPVEGQLSLQLRSLHNPDNRLKVQATLLKKVCQPLPTYLVSKDVQQSFSSLELADTDFSTPSEIDLLLGSDIYYELLTEQEPCIIKNLYTGLVAQNTIFGYIIQGKLEAEYSTTTHSALQTYVTLDQTLEKFWQIEEIATKEITSPEDELCEDSFIQTTYRLPSGRFSVNLPLKSDACPEALQNRNSALANFYHLERRLSKNEKLREAYDEQMRSYLKMGHMTLHNGEPSPYIMPQLLVVREKAKTTKLRVVFNASALAYNSVTHQKQTFNDMLMPGPRLQADLSEILLRFRRHEVAITADVKMMFRMIMINPTQRKYQHIFYRKNPDEELQEYEISVLLFGERSSPYLAQRVVKELISRDGHMCPEAAAALEHNTYIDDYVDSVPTVTDAKQRKEEVSTLMRGGGFQLRKWASSHPDVLSDTPTDDMEKIEFTDENQSMKILGLQWIPQNDYFSFQVQDFHGSVTKRSCLSYIARTFDCLGLVAPVTFWMKSFVQKLWTEKLAWDEPLPGHLSQNWNDFVTHITALQKLKIPRCVMQNNSVTVHLAAFSDASELGYATCIYLVVNYADGSVSSNLITAKSKVSPLKTISIPRLELCGFLLMAQLCQAVTRALKIKLDGVHLFCDSEIVLAWLRKPPHLLQTFPANRVTKILELTEGYQISHVPTNLNAADCASRGLSPDALPSHTIWWAGPPFLMQSPETWGNTDWKEPAEVPEMKKPQNVVATTVKPSPMPILDLLNRHSSLPKLQRVTAYVLRFVDWQKTKRKGPLTVPELEKSLQKLVYAVQQHDFTAKDPRLRKLHVFTDKQKLLRVGGRLRNAKIPDAAKHPLVLPKQSHLSTLIVQHCHRILLHSGPNTTRALVLKKYWIISAHSLIRYLTHRCLTCRRWEAKPQQPFMGDLPGTRVNASRAFAYCGLDFAGPFSTKESRVRSSVTHKSYFCVFVCEATKAVHLEHVTDLTTEAFLACIDRFAARRSLPQRLRSDNGRTFIGANRVLSECKNFLKNSDIHSHLRARNIEWDFNPSYGSHFGGLFEAAVKSAKRLLYKEVGASVLTLEEFSTLLARVEAVLNSRPIAFVASNPNDDIDYLSPGHFLVGGPLVSPPEIPLDDLKTTPVTRWNRVRKMSQIFWKRWQTEYLHSLMQREKWQRKPDNLAVGQLVYMLNERTSPTSWPLGRVAAIYPGADGVVRVVDVKTAYGLYRRPVNKLVRVTV